MSEQVPVSRKFLEQLQEKLERISVVLEKNPEMYRQEQHDVVTAQEDVASLLRGEIPHSCGTKS